MRKVQPFLVLKLKVDFAMNVLVPDLKAIGLDEVIYNRENGLSSVRSMPIQMKKLLLSALLRIWIQPITTRKILSLAS